MFGIGMQEVLLILVIALVVIGPKKLPEVAKALGKGYGEFRRAFDDMKQSINVDMRTEEEKERLRRIHERVQPPPEKPEEAPAEPPVPAGKDTKADAPAYGPGDEEIEGGGS